MACLMREARTRGAIIAPANSCVNSVYPSALAPSDAPMREHDRHRCLVCRRVVSS